MAKRRRKTTKKSRGGTLMGIMIGLILGLVAAVVVALFVTQAPMPFVDKASRDPSKTTLPDLRNAPDPNIGLQGNSQPLPNNIPDIKDDTVPDNAPPPFANAEPSGDNLGDFISGLAKPKPQPEQIPGVTQAAKQAPPSKSKTESTANTQTTYYLQAGAFKSKSDAEAIQARILMLGLQTNIQEAQVNGDTINRVRVGPFAGIDALNQARSRLGQENIETAVVRP